jgi:hypothetical protein
MEIGGLFGHVRFTRIRVTSDPIFLGAYAMATISPPAKQTGQTSAKSYLWLGIGLVLVGPVLMIAQFSAKIMRTPWYLPALATAGAILILVALVRRPTVWRVIALALAALLGSAEWYFIVSLSKLPAYTGPVENDRAFPAFTTTLADGSSFDQRSLQGEQNTVLTFFRGRW